MPNAFIQAANSLKQNEWLNRRVVLSPSSAPGDIGMTYCPKLVMRMFLLLSLIVATFPSVLAQSDAAASQTSSSVVAENRLPARATTPDDKSYRIGVGDLLDVRVLNHPEMSRKMRVEGDGTVRVPVVGNVTATCLTESQLSQIITEKFRKWIREPYVDVFIEEYNSQPVAVIGAVDKPGRFQLQRRVRLIELLSYAGGPKLEKAGHTLHLIRSGEKELCAADSAVASPTTTEDPIPQLLSFKLKDLLMGSTEANLYVQPGDIISLPEADQIFVTGFVTKPGPFPLNTKITLTQAIGMAGGYMPEAAKKKVRLIRQSTDSNARIEQVINVEDIEKRKIDDIVLQANDLIEVPNSAGKVFMKALLTTGPGSLVNALPFAIIR
ncbi:MAG TPA: polysaccharide biosynthesis/export family protein [Blastocatellia bacterium]|nr:polysaccharide biosynthesis/export family protein [Blastocatellia bacterium]